MTVLDTSKEVGDKDQLKAEASFAESDPEGVAFEYEILE
jgi:hypothetical protein